jgi:dynein heavy chain, axonemal
VFITTMCVPEFNISLVLNSIRLTQDPPKGICANAVAVLTAHSATKAEKKFYAECARPEPWRQLYFQLCLFHSVIRERRRFGPVGWNNPYDFNNSDFRISMRHLKQLV